MRRVTPVRVSLGLLPRLDDDHGVALADEAVGAHVGQRDPMVVVQARKQA